MASSQDQTTPTPPAPPADPLASLYKMSRTAGVGAQEYVAINVLSVFALVLGLASGLVVFGATFYIIPLAAIVIGILAFRQISSSNGTQTGRSIATLGLLAALAWAGYQAAVHYHQLQSTRQDRQELAGLLQALGTDIAQDQFEAAYARFTDRFRDRVPLETFRTFWINLEQIPGVGGLKSLRETGLYQFETDPSTGLKIAQATAILEFEKSPGSDRRLFHFKRTDQWKIDDIPEFFAAPAAPAGQ